MLTVINTLEGLDMHDDDEIQRYWSSDALRTLYFEPKNLSAMTCEEALASSSFRSQLQRVADIVESRSLGTFCEQIVSAFEENAGHRVLDRTLYLVLGCGTTSIYSIMKDGREVSVLCVESLGGSTSVLKMYLAHEYTHWVRRQLLETDIFESCIGDRLVTEGIAENYSREAVPGRSTAEYCIVDEPTAQWTRDNEADLSALVHGKLEEAELMETALLHVCPHRISPKVRLCVRVSDREALSGKERPVNKGHPWSPLAGRAVRLLLM